MIMERKYCKTCNKWYDDLKFRYCPECAGELISDVQLEMERLFSRYSKEYVLKCGCCGEYFPKDYNMCPYCKNELEKQDIFFIDWQNEVLSSRFMDFSCTATFDELYGHYVLTKWKLAPGQSVPEHEVYDCVMSRIDDYFKSRQFGGNCCEKCDKSFSLNYKYCPFCGDELADCEYLLILREARDLCDGCEINRCDECGENYPLDYKYCPVCANPLKRENQFWIDEENRLIKAYWNDKVEAMTFAELHEFIAMGHIDDMPSPICLLTLLFYKDEYDGEFENSFHGRRMPKKLTCQEMAKLVEKVRFIRGNSYGFMNSQMAFDKFGMDLKELKAQNPKMIVVKLRRNLFYVIECKERIFLG